MDKLKLKLDALQVESFDVWRGVDAGRGTVRGAEVEDRFTQPILDTSRWGTCGGVSCAAGSCHFCTDGICDRTNTCDTSTQATSERTCYETCGVTCNNENTCAHTCRTCEPCF